MTSGEPVSGVLADILQEVERVIVGQRPLLERLLIGLLTEGHVLVEGMPGLAKSLTVSSLANSLGLTFQRIQFTADLLPADLTGTLVIRPGQDQFVIRKGPIFAQIVLADEINRAPAKVQSALLEAMQERQVTIGEDSLPLPRPFLVLATQNPVEHEGTYPLPEAEVDRFLLKVTLNYPEPAAEKEVLRRHGATSRVPEVRPVCSAEEFQSLQAGIDQVHVEEALLDYVVAVVSRTRDPSAFGLHELAPLVRYGVSPRAGICLVRGARARAVLFGRDYVLPADIKDLCGDVLAHRIGLTYEAMAQQRTGQDVVRAILESVEVP